MQREIQQLRDERNGYQMSALTQQQTQNLVNTLRPCPIPAYLTCSPYAGMNFPFGYNGVYTLNMAKADYYGSSIQNEQQLAQFVKDFLDDVDGSPEKPFRYFYSMCMANGVVIEWSDIL